MTNQSGAAEKTTFTSVFNETISPLRRRRRIGKARGKALGKAPAPRKRAGACGRRIKPADPRQPLRQNESAAADPAASAQKSDLAFQYAMRCAIAQGLEHPPRVGVMKDVRPLTAPRLFEPVPLSSGCTSPAQECADLIARSD